MSRVRRQRRRFRHREADIAARRAWTPQLNYPAELPISAERAKIQAAIVANPVVIVAGDTGSGKTTQLPKMCLELGRGVTGQIALTQPRRLAAHAVAKRLAAETALPPGTGIGLHVRFDDASEPSAPVRVMTDGILLTEISADPLLTRYDTVIVDEAHERSLNIDFLLGCLRRALAERADLRVVVTSATINTAAFAEFFAAAPVISVAGRTYPVEIDYDPVADDEPLAAAIGRVAADLFDRLPSGDVLVFLPGEREILDVAKVLARPSHYPRLVGIDIIPVYGRLPDDEQRRVFEPGAARRLVLATNVAETSLTLPRIHAVIDSGLVRISRYSVRSKIQRLATEQVSQASARQRAGRCGRLGPGVCVRLYSEDSFSDQAAYTDPEVVRTDLASVTLRMLDARLGDIDKFPWLDRPDPSRVRDAKQTLRDIGATDRHGRLKRTGKHLARLSVDPRLGRVLLGAAQEGVLSQALIVVAALAVGNPQIRPSDRRAAADVAHREFAGKQADFETYLNLWAAWGQIRGGQRRWMLERFLSPKRMFDWRAVHRQLTRQCKDVGIDNAASAPAKPTTALARAFVGAFASQSLQHDTDGFYRGLRGSRARLHPGGVLAGQTPPWVLAIELVRTHDLYAREVMRIRPRWLLAAAPQLISTRVADYRWNPAKRCAEATATRSLDSLIVAVDTVALAKYDNDAARELLVRHAVVRDDAELDSAFMDVYRDQLAATATREGQVRRALLRPEDERVEWFMARLPTDVITLADLTKTLAIDPSLDSALRAPLGVVAASIDANGNEFPESLSIAGRELALRYRYAPGKSNDGVRIEVPASIRATLRQADIDAAVPQFFRERVVAYLRKLPKRVRTRLHPIAESAARLADTLADQDDDLPLAERLRLTLTAELGLDDDAFDGWQVLADDDHRSPKVDILPDGHLAEPAPPRTAAWDWQFGALPADSVGPPFVALSVAGADGVTTREFRQQSAAIAAHQRAVLVLLAAACKAPLSFAAAGLAEAALSIARLCDYVDSEGLADRMGYLAVDALADGNTRLAIRDGAAFNNLANTVRASVAGRLQSALDSLVAISAALRDVRVALDGAVSEAVRDDVEQQLLGLLPDTFPDGISYCNFNNIKRYLNAITYRLQRCAARASRDQEAMRTVHRLRQQLQRLPASVATEPAAIAFRWALEELRVSLFAEPLGTAFKVSPARLEKQWQALLQR
ncbi:MAG: ATP-dependent RNA helicase HrpA [Pseudomonadota bacterium]